MSKSMRNATVALFSTLVISRQSRAQVTYQLEEFGGQFPAALINDSGNGAGSVNSEAKFWWADQNQVVDLGDLMAPNSPYDVATAIANNNSVCGWTPGPIRGFIWDEAGGIRMAGPDYSTFVFGINDLWAICGRSINPDIGKWMAFVWSETNGTTYIPRLEEQTDGEAYDINNLGEVSGVAGLSGARIRSFFWSAVDGVRVLGPLPDGTVASYAGKINNQGQIAALAVSATAQYSFIWSAHVSPETSPIEVIEETQALQPDGGVWLINDRGEVIGNGAWEPLEFENYLYVAGSGRPLRRFTRRIDPCQPLNLRQSFPARFSAVDLNNLGQIAGVLDSQSSTPTIVRLTPYIAGDPDFDGDTDLYDLAVTLAHFGEADPSLTFAEGDVDEDAVVDLADLAHVLVNFGRRCPTP